MAHLEETTPIHDRLVPSHGDFHDRQVLSHNGEFVVLDLDEMCLAPPAFDLATFGAHLVHGRPGDLERARRVLDALVAGYGPRPADLDWYLAVALLARSPFPFRKDLDAEWPERIWQMVEGARSVLR
jgi:aminoglycoside phosphotransferase (APT) family kinase protein